MFQEGHLRGNVDSVATVDRSRADGISADSDYRVDRWSLVRAADTPCTESNRTLHAWSTNSRHWGLPPKRTRLQLLALGRVDNGVCLHGSSRYLGIDTAWSSLTLKAAAWGASRSTGARSATSVGGRQLRFSDALKTAGGASQVNGPQYQVGKGMENAKNSIVLRGLGKFFGAASIGLTGLDAVCTVAPGRS